jgi:urease accessory protein
MFRQTMSFMMSNRLFKSAAAAAALMAAAGPAAAHHAMGGATPENFSQGLLSGLAHPIIGPDHFAFLVIAALLTFTLKPGPRLTVPLAFVAATIAGTLLHLGSANIPLSEALVALSVIVGAVLVLSRRSMHALGLSALFAASGILHGYAYGESIVGAEATPILAYLVGFGIIQYALIVAGAFALEKVSASSAKAQLLAQRGGGLATLIIGGVFFALGVA